MTYLLPGPLDEAARLRRAITITSRTTAKTPATMRISVTVSISYPSFHLRMAPGTRAKCREAKPVRGCDLLEAFVRSSRLCTGKCTRNFGKTVEIPGSGRPTPAARFATNSIVLKRIACMILVHSCKPTPLHHLPGAVNSQFKAAPGSSSRALRPLQKPSKSPAVTCRRAAGRPWNRVCCVSGRIAK